MADTYKNTVSEYSTQTPRHVAVLPPELANQIAAGEVVERPASVVKELVENSLDAGARRVEVHVEDGGRALIRVDDDGCGMEREDALRALERHATSKITNVDDLFNICTLGFRGEALPSIASVSRFEIKSKTHGSLSGTRIAVAGGVIEAVEDAGMAAGTSITIRDLFFNTPARLKFLKTPGTEARHITEMLVRMGLSRPDVRILLHRDGKTRLDLAPVEDIKDRVLDVMGREVYDVLYPTFEYPAVHGVVARGYFSKPGHKQRTQTNVYTFVNGRYISDRTVRAAIMGAYGTLMEKGRYPSVVLYLDVPHAMVDINVHPAKHEVRFHDTNSIYRAVYHAIADALAQTPWVEREVKPYVLQPYAQGEDRKQVEVQPGLVRERFVSPAMASFEVLGKDRRHQMDPARLKAARYDYRDPEHPFYPQQVQVQIQDVVSHPEQQGFQTPGAQPLPVDRTTLFPQHTLAVPQGDVAAQQTGEDAGVFAQRSGGIEAAMVAQEGTEKYFSALRVIGQFKRQYILCEDASGLVIIDQHAAHERIGFERLKKIFATDYKETQPLLFPKRIELDTLRADVMHEHLDFFNKAGFEVEHFGQQSFVLKSVPAIFQKANIDKIVRDALDDLAQSGRTSRMDEALEAVLSRMACHSVVRGPTSLTIEECEGLLEQMDEIDFAANCPHGRPVYFRMSLYELEGSFERH